MSNFSVATEGTIVWIFFTIHFLRKWKIGEKFGANTVKLQKFFERLNFPRKRGGMFKLLQNMRLLKFTFSSFSASLLLILFCFVFQSEPEKNLCNIMCWLAIFRFRKTELQPCLVSTIPISLHFLTHQAYYIKIEIICSFHSW